ncbi:hypothetical protein CN936_28310 [Bacillus cereus]|nr:hypothetical protein COK29_27400 [Bacillus cereus]PGL89863.1 hypothetical protein CN936_28310 [Bacillus cereus]
MNKLLQPSIIGQITECSRSVMFQNAEPGAKIILTRTRNGRSDDVGETRPVAISSGIVTLQNGEKFKTGDRVSIYQMTPTETSPHSFPDVEVQASVENYNIAVLDGLYSCSRVLTLGGMRAGGKVELLNGTSVIGTGDVDGEGVAYVYVDSGLPSEGTILTARLHFCPNPPPPSGASEYVKDIPLPRVGAPPLILPKFMAIS